MIKTKIALLALVMFTSACLFSKRDDDAAAGGGGGGTTKVLASLRWANANDAYTIDMRNAVIGSPFSATFANPQFSCTCNVTMSGTEASGTYTSSCTVATGTETGSFSCRYYEAPKLANGGTQECTNGSSTVAGYTYTGTSLKFGNCGHAGAIEYF